MSITESWDFMRVIDLFAGAGGMSLGLRNAGFDVVAAYDAWHPAIATYQHNMGNHIKQRDLKDILNIGSELAQLKADMICGGPPCQDYSIAGERQEGENASMTKAFAMLVCIAKPQWFLMENVVQANNSMAWAEAREILQRTGYGFTECKLDASYYGVPQSRKRLFIIGRIGERDGFLTSVIKAVKSEKQTVIGDVLGYECSPIFLYPRFRLNKAVWQSHEAAPTIIASSLRAIPNTHLVPTEIVTPTLTQIGQLQGFPIDWEWLGSSRHANMKMIANAVPPPLAEAIGRVILQRETGQSIPAVQGNFVRWLMQQGQCGQVARNTKSHLMKAQCLLGGRTFQDIRHEILALEEVPKFNELHRKVKSNLRATVRLYSEFRSFSNKGMSITK